MHYNVRDKTKKEQKRDKPFIKTIKVGSRVAKQREPKRNRLKEGNYNQRKNKEGLVDQVEYNKMLNQLEP